MNRHRFSPEFSVITGGASGIGAEMARALSKRGGKVMIVDTNSEGASAVKREIGENCDFTKLDVSKPEDVDAFYKNLAQKNKIPDCLFNAAGINHYAESLGINTSNWLDVLAVNLTGTALMSLAAYQLMAKRGSGTIINMGSMATFLVEPMFNPYTTSKFGVVGFSRSLSYEAEFYGVKIHVVCPGNIATPMRGERYNLSKLTPAMHVESAVRGILKGVEQNKKIIVFPLHAKFFYLLEPDSECQFF